MPGFHRGGYETAVKAIEREYEISMRELQDRLDNTSPSQKNERDQINKEIACCKEEFHKAQASLKKSLY